MNSLIRICAFNLLLSFFINCTSKTQDLLLEKEDPISMQELTSAMINTSPSPSGRKTIKNKHNKEIKNCIKIISQFGKPLKKLRTHLTSIPRHSDLAPFRIARLSPAHCTGSNYRKTLHIAKYAINHHSRKIGVILPLSGQHQSLANAVLKGVKIALKKFHKNAKIVIKDSQGTQAGTLHALAELVFFDQVSMLIGGLSHAEAEILTPYSKELMTPMLVLNKSRDLIKDNPYIFQIYPNELDLAKALSFESKKRGFKKITILKPAGGKSDQIVELFQKTSAKLEIDASQEFLYAPGDYPTMDKAIAEVTQTNPEHRPEEYDQLLLEAEERAEEEGTTFHKRSVILPAQIETDALFIPDHYTMVRYFIKLLKYHGVEQIPLIGTYEWRSSELIKPWDSFIDDSFFADFIGSYQAIPAEIRIETPDSDLFVSDKFAASVDFQLIGYRAANIALRVVNTPFLKRKYLTRHLSNQKENLKFFKSRRTFHKNRSIRWPIFLFSIKNEQIEISSEWRDDLINHKQL